MPITLKLTEEARLQLVKSWKEVAEKLVAIQKSLTNKEEHLGQTIEVLGKALTTYTPVSHHLVSSDQVGGE